MTKIGFLGLGMMSSGMASCLFKAGHDVTVWNRSPQKAQALIEAGAKLAASPKEAAKGAEVVFSMVADDVASDLCWVAEDGALDALASGTCVIVCSTISHGQSSGSTVNGPKAIRKQGCFEISDGLDAVDLAVNPAPRQVLIELSKRLWRPDFSVFARTLAPLPCPW